MTTTTIIDEPAELVAARIERLFATRIERTDLDTLAAFAAELAERVSLLATLPAEPGDTAVEYLEHRAEALELVEAIASGLQLMAVPE